MWALFGRCGSMMMKFVVFMLMAGIMIVTCLVPKSEGVRIMKEFNLKSPFDSQLPKRPVPPSEPSRCHYLAHSPTAYNPTYYYVPSAHDHQDYVICP